MHTDAAHRPSLLPDGDDLSDEAIAVLVDLVYALGDYVAASYADRLHRYDRDRRAEALALQPEPHAQQLDLFPADLLDPF